MYGKAISFGIFTFYMQLMKINHYRVHVCYAILLDLFIFNKLSQSVFEMRVISF